MCSKLPGIPGIPTFCTLVSIQAFWRRNSFCYWDKMLNNDLSSPLSSEKYLRFNNSRHLLLGIHMPFTHMHISTHWHMTLKNIHSNWRTAGHCLYPSYLTRKKTISLYCNVYVTNKSIFLIIFITFIIYHAGFWGRISSGCFTHSWTSLQLDRIHIKIHLWPGFMIVFWAPNSCCLAETLKESVNLLFTTCKASAKTEQVCFKGWYFSPLLDYTFQKIGFWWFLI